MSKTEQKIQDLRTYVSTKEACSLVPDFSADTVARLAREGLIEAVRKDGRWLISVSSLVAFKEDSKLEEKIRAERTRQERLQESEEANFIFDWQINKNNFVTTKSSSAVLVFTSGFLVGVFLFVFSLMHQVEGDRALTTVVTALVDSVPSVASLASVNSANPQVFNGPINREFERAETVDLINAGQGIVLLDENSTSTKSIPEMFSDKVEVIKETETGGYIRLETATGSEELPFVKLPTP